MGGGVGGGSGWWGGGVRVDVIEELKFSGKFTNFWRGSQGGGGWLGRAGGRVGEGRVGCERRLKVFVKIQKKNLGGESGDGVRWGGRVGGVGGLGWK